MIGEVGQTWILEGFSALKFTNDRFPIKMAKMAKKWPKMTFFGGFFRSEIYRRAVPDQNGRKWPKMAKNGQNGQKMAKMAKKSPKFPSPLPPPKIGVSFV